MSLTYHDPQTVLNPRQFIRKVDVLYDGGVDGFSLAVIDWEGTPHVAMRWNVAFKEHGDAEKQAGVVMCAGSPSLKGIPSWFILPRELFTPELFDKDTEQFMRLVAGWGKNA
jgi:hypothetical protein